MSDRLNELRRQRTLISEHLAWLDREIAGESVRSGQDIVSGNLTDSAPQSSAMSAAAQRATRQLESSVPADAEKILEQYSSEPGSVHSSVRRGCFIYLALAVGLLAIGAFAFYLFSSSR